MGLSLGANLTILPWRASASVNYIFSEYVLIAIILSLITGLLVLANVLATFTKQRQRDIGIMKAIGLVGEAGSFFMAEATIIATAGCTFGVFLGAIAYTIALRVLSFFHYGIPLIIPPTILVVLLTVMITVSIAVTYFHLNGTLMRLKAAETISTDLFRTIVTSGIYRSKSLGFPYKVAIRSLVARWKETTRVVVASILCVMLVSILVFGGQTISSTTSSYIERGIGKDVLLIASPRIADLYVHHLSSYLLKLKTQNSTVPGKAWG